MGVVYVLELEQGKWYVGYTEQVCCRIAQHFMGRGSYWTQLHKPVRVVSLTKGPQELEDPSTIALMAEKGWRNVRGGSWSSPNLGAMPLPIARALSIDPRRTPLREPREESYDFEDHALQVDEYRGQWRARVTGPKAAQTQRGVRTFKATNEGDVRSMAEAWVRGQEEDFDPDPEDV